VLRLFLLALYAFFELNKEDSMRILMSLLIAVFLMGGEAVAEESICDGQIGAAYGLCNAYCEAMDCDNESHQPSDRACEKVRKNYRKITGYNVLPCDVAWIKCDWMPGPDDYFWVPYGEVESIIMECGLRAIGVAGDCKGEHIDYNTYGECEMSGCWCGDCNDCW
jgi:hypothetical protein